MDYVKKTVEELLNINNNNKVYFFIKELAEHTDEQIKEEHLRTLIEENYKNEVGYEKNDNDNKLKSWIECLGFLQDYFKGKDDSYKVKLF
jgi:hypothetical protein